MTIINYALFLLLLSSNMGLGMTPNKNPMNFQILQAVERNDAEYLEKLLKSESEYCSLTYLLPTHFIDFPDYLKKAENQKKEAGLRKHTYCNLSFYKDLVAGMASLGVAAFITTMFIAIPMRDNQIDFLRNIVGCGGAVATSTGLAIHHLKRAFKNQQAKEEYMRALAIKLLLQKADTSCRVKV